MKQTIRLTESELRDYINNAVCEALEDEGFFGGIGSLASKATNRMGKAIGGATDAIGGVFNKGKEAVTKAYKGAKQQVGDAYQNTKKTYQMGSINQDAQSAIKKAVDALNNLMKLDTESMKYSQQHPINTEAMENIKKCITSLTKGGITSVSGGFKGNKTAFSK